MKITLPLCLCLWTMALGSAAESAPVADPSSHVANKLVPAVPANNSQQRSEGPFDKLRCDAGVSRSRCEWVTNPYKASLETNQQSEMRKKLQETVGGVSFGGQNLEEVVHHLAYVYKINIILDPNLSSHASITLSLQEAPVYDMIGYLAETCGLNFRIDDHAVYIGDKATFATPENPSAAESESVADLSSHVANKPVSAVPANNSHQRSEGPFDKLRGDADVIRSRCEWVINPYKESLETNQQGEMRKKLQQTVGEVQFEETSLEDVVLYLSQKYKINVVLHPNLSSHTSVTLRLQEIPVYDMISYITETCGLNFRIDDHAVYIGDKVIFAPDENP